MLYMYIHMIFIVFFLDVLLLYPKHYRKGILHIASVFIKYILHVYFKKRYLSIGINMLFRTISPNKRHIGNITYTPRTRVTLNSFL